MRLATLRTSSGTRAARIEDGSAVLLDAADVGVLLQHPGWRDRAAGPGEVVSLDGADYAPVIPNPSKIICSGLNYSAHIAESGLPTPDNPILFAKYATALTGARDDLVLPDLALTRSVDWEAELAVVIGTPVGRNVSESEAESYIGGYTVLNDVSVRDWQNRTNQWLQGKTWEGLTPVGPTLVTSDEFGWSGHRISCTVDDEVMQDANTSELVFTPPILISYLSRITTLNPGDLIATGTPGGIGGAMTPPRFLAPGNTVRVEIEGLGATVNVCRAAST